MKCGKEEKYSHCVLVFSSGGQMDNKNKKRKLGNIKYGKENQKRVDCWEIRVSVCKTGDLGSIPVLEKIP